MIKCTICKNHQCDNKKNTCSKCKSKIIYGTIQEPFIDCCGYFSMTESEKQRRAYYKQIVGKEK